jgi:hypothetical protein
MPILLVGDDFGSDAPSLQEKNPTSILLVGEDFGNAASSLRGMSPAMRDLYALTGATGRRIASLAGVSWLQYLHDTTRTNIVWVPDQWKDPARVLDGVARVRAQMVREGRTIVFGVKAQQALTMSKLEPMIWYMTAGGTDMAVMPHPSGLNRWYNDPANVARAGDFLREALCADS